MSEIETASDDAQKTENRDQDPSQDFIKKKRASNLVIGCVLFVIIVLIYFVSIIRMSNI